MGTRLLRALAGVALGAALLSPASLAGQGRLRASVSPSRIVFPTPGVQEFEQGSVRHDGITVDVETRGFVFWILAIRARSSDLGGYGKPLSDLQWRQPGDAWQAISTSDQIVAFGFRSRQVELDFRTLLSWERDVPGEYGTGVTLRLSSLFGNARASVGRLGPLRGRDPQAVCASLAVEVGGGGDGARGGGSGSGRAIEQRCVDRLREGRQKLRSAEEAGERTP